MKQTPGPAGDLKTARDYRTIRSRLTRIVVVPSIVLLAMWAVFSSYLIVEGYAVRAVAFGVQDVSIPAVNTFAALQRERQLTMLSLSAPTPDSTALQAQRANTDVTLEALSGKLGTLTAQAPPEIVDRVHALQGLLGQLPKVRAEVNAGGPKAKNDSFNYYNAVLDGGSELFETQARVVPDAVAGQAGLTAAHIFRAADEMSRSASLGAGALAAGQFTGRDHLHYAALVGAYHDQLAANIPYAQPDVRDQYARLVGSTAMHRLTTAEDDLVERGGQQSRPARPGDLGTTEQDYRTATDEVAGGLVQIATAQAADGAALGINNGNLRFTEVTVGSLIALLAVLTGIVLAVRNSRRLVDGTLVTRLAMLRTAALQLANERLPEIMSRLRHGEQVDVAEEIPPLDFGADEIGQLADAFNTAQLTAVAAAVQEGQARDGAAKVFLGIARRNQVLVHRQLKIIDGMERKEDKPERLDTLFQLDHLATRARRNAENLIILSGEKPGRQWRKPVRLVDILRAAVAETEQYTRIRVNPVPGATVVGAAVSDTIHLLAELMDNATSFSSPRSPVEVHATSTPQGVLIEVEDHGLGMSRDYRDGVNALLANPPEFGEITLRGDPRLGLFVVGRLAHRRGITVQLRSAPEGGTLAVVVLPADIVGAPAPADAVADPTRLTNGSQHRSAEVDVANIGYPLPGSNGQPNGHREPDGATPHPAELGNRSPAPETPAPQIGSTEQSPRNPGAPLVPLTEMSMHEVSLTEPPTTENPVVPADGRPPLPRRRRLASLAPQLRVDPGHGAAEDPDDVVPSPERAGGNLAAFQRGTRAAWRSTPRPADQADD